MIFPNVIINVFFNNNIVITFATFIQQLCCLTLFGNRQDDTEETHQPLCSLLDP